jgi:hypothetical protein
MFPLRMSSIERLHFHDDWPGFPNQIFARAQFRGELNLEHAREALLLAARRHVWSNAVVRGGSDGGWRWDWDDANVPQFVWQGDQPFQFEPIDLRRGPVCRMVGRQLGTGCELTFQVHHAVVDGLGGLQYLRDWLVIYDNLVAGRPHDSGLPELEIERLRDRNRLGLLRRKYLLNVWRQAIGLFGASKFLLRRFATIRAPEHRTDWSYAGFPGYEVASWNDSELSKLRAYVRREKISLNDWLLAALFLSLDEWHREQFGSGLTGWSRLIVPINLRTPDDRLLPAANRASLVQIDRRAQTERDQLSLAKGISYELNLIRDWQLDRMFLLLVRGMSVSDAWLRRAVRRNKPRATSMLTNLGKPLLRLGLPLEEGKVLAGGLRLEQLDVIGPIRYGMPLSFAVAEYAGNLRMTAHFDRQRLHPEQVRALVERIERRGKAPSA